MRRLPIIACAALVSLRAFADDQTSWGRPVNGLRIGVESGTTSATADQELTFTVRAQNVSPVPITIPTPDTYVLETTRSDDFHTTPLQPVIASETLPFFSGPQTASTTQTASTSSDVGPTVESLAAHVLTIAPGQAVTWNDVPLGRGFYIGEHLEDNHKTEIEKSVLQPDGQYRIQFRFANDETPIANGAVWTGQADSGTVEMHVSAARTDGIKVGAGFSLPKHTYFVGEPIEATFTVTNRGPVTIHFPTGGDYGSSGRHNRFSISAVDSWGWPVSDPLGWKGLFGGAMRGGLGGMVEVKPGGSYTEKVLLNEWCAFAKAGTYTIDCKRTLNTIVSDQGGVDLYAKVESSLPAVPVETTLEVTLNDDAKAQADYIAGLVPALMKNDQNADGASQQIKSLAQAQSPAVFPEIVKLLEAGPRFQSNAVEWLSDYGSGKAAPVFQEHFATLSPQARLQALDKLSEWNAPGAESLVAAALRDKDNELRANTVLICASKWYDSCVPILLTMGNDPDPLVRRYLGAALGASGDPQAIPVLLNLLHDSGPDPYIKIWAAEGLGKFKRMDGVPVMIDLLRDPKRRGDEGNVMQTLLDLTGKDFSDNRNSYLDWWENGGRAVYEKH